MSLTEIITKPSLRGSLTTLGPWAGLFARSGFRVYPYQSGCALRAAAAAATQVDTYGMGAFAAGDYAMVCSRAAAAGGYIYTPNISKLHAVDTIGTADDELNLGSAMTASKYDWLLNIGVDPTQDFDASDVTLFNDPVGADGEATNPYLTTGLNGLFEGWVEDSDAPIVDLLITDSSGVPVAVWPSFQLGRGVVS